MSLYKLYRSDKDLERQGVWLNFGENSDGQEIRVKVARVGGSNHRYAKAMERATRPHRRAIAAGTLSDAQSRRIFYEVYADTILLDWEGVQGPDDKPLPYNRENVLKVFNDLPDFFNVIREQAEQLSNFQDGGLEDDLGNCGQSSNTTLNKGRQKSG